MEIIYFGSHHFVKEENRQNQMLLLWLRVRENVFFKKKIPDVYISSELWTSTPRISASCTPPNKIHEIMESLHAILYFFRMPSQHCFSYLSIGLTTESKEILMSSSYAQENSTLMVLSRVIIFPVLFALSIQTVFLYIIWVLLDYSMKRKNAHA